MRVRFSVFLLMCKTVLLHVARYLNYKINDVSKAVFCCHQVLGGGQKTCLLDPLVEVASDVFMTE